MVETIPQEILLDYQNRTVVSVENLRWDNAAHTSLTADVLFLELEPMGAVPFTAVPDADTRHGLEIWEKASLGDYGPIAEYVPPTTEQVRAAMPKLTGRQLRLALASIGIMEADIDAALADDPEGMIEWKWATEYSRTHELIDGLGVGFSLTPEQIDDLWVWAAVI